MATSGVNSGSIMRVYVGAYTVEEAVGYATDCSIEFSMGEITISHKDVTSNWKAISGGELSCTISTNALYAEPEVASGQSFDDFWDALIAGTNVYLKFTTEVAGDVYYYGQFLVTSLSLNAPNNESVTYSASFTSNGEIKSGVVGTDDTGV